MSTAEDAVFLAAVQADPDDETARLAYADWLEERGDSDGELVRLVCQVQREWYADSPAWRRLEQLGGGLRAVIDPLDERRRRLLACDYAERVLPLIEGRLSEHSSPRQALQTARRVAAGQVSQKKLQHHDRALWYAGCWSWGRSEQRVVLAALKAVESAVGGDAIATAREVRAAIGAVPGTGRAGKFAERRRQLCRAVEYRLGFFRV